MWEELLTPYLILDMKQDNSLKGSKWEDTNIEYTDLNKSLLQNTLNERLEKRKDSVRFVDGDVFYVSWT